MSSHLKLKRRDLIKGLGAIGALSSLSVETLMAQTQAKAPLRLLIIPTQFGWGLTPDTNYLMTFNGDNFTFPSAISNLNKIKDKMSVINGLFGARGWGNAHDLSYSDILTGSVYFGDKSSPFNTHFPTAHSPSIETLIENRTNKPAFRFSATYRSWGENFHPLHFDMNAKLIEPHLNSNNAWNSHFKDLPVDTGSSNPIISGSGQVDINLFSFLKKSIERRMQGLTSAEKESLDNYANSVDGLSLKKSPTTGYSGKLKLSFDGSKRDPKQGPALDIEDFYEMVKVGFANNMTNAAILSIGDRVFSSKYEKFHETHSHGNTDIWWSTRNEMAGQLVKFVQELDAIEDFDGSSLLDNTLILLTGEVATGSHSHNFICPLIGASNWIPHGKVYYSGTLTTGFSKNGAMKHFDNERYVAFEQWSNKATFYGREVADGTLYHVKTGGNTSHLFQRTWNDLFREICNLYGMNLTTFGLPSLNRGDVIK